MSFREKSAWISFVAIFVIFGFYFARVAGVVFAGHSAQGLGRLFFVLVCGLVLVEVVLHVAVAAWSPHDARTPKDERERLIELRATRLAFPVLLGGALAAIGTMHLSAGRWEMAHAVLLAIVAAELVRFGAQIVYYRRDA